MRRGRRRPHGVARWGRRRHGRPGWAPIVGTAAAPGGCPPRCPQLSTGLSTGWGWCKSSKFPFPGPRPAGVSAPRRAARHRGVLLAPAALGRLPEGAPVGVSGLDDRLTAAHRGVSDSLRPVVGMPDGSATGPKPLQADGRVRVGTENRLSRPLQAVVGSAVLPTRPGSHRRRRSAVTGPDMGSPVGSAGRGQRRERSRTRADSS